MLGSVLESLIGAVIIGLIIGWMTALEVIWPRNAYPLRRRLPGLGFNIATTIGGGVLVSSLSMLWARAGVTAIVLVPIRGVLGDVLSVATSLLFFDLIEYWNHRFQHRFLWRIHVVHHSQTELHAANDYAHFTERGLRFLLFVVPLSLINFDFAPTPVLVVFIRSALEFYIHSPTKLHFGPASAILVDNRFHRIHHSLEPRHFDKNFGILFSFWDRMFGTVYDPRPSEWPDTGVEGLQPPRSLLDYLVFPLRHMGLAAEGSSAAKPPVLTECDLTLLSDG